MPPPIGQPTYQFLWYGHQTRDVNAVLKKRGGALALGNNFPAVPDYLQPNVLAAFQNCFAPLRSFVTVFDPTPYSPKAKNILKYVDAGSATLVDGTDFQQGGSALAAIECSVNHLSQPWPVSHTDLNSGIREADLFLANAQALATTIMQKIGALLTSANYPGAAVVSPPGGFGLSNAADAYGRITGQSKSLILDTPYFAQISHQSPRGFVSGDAVHGWRGGIHECSAGWDTAEAKVHGLACNPKAIAVVSGFIASALFDVPHFQRTLLGIPGIDLTVEYNRWYHQATRTTWRSLDAIFGCGKGDGAGAILFKTP